MLTNTWPAVTKSITLLLPAEAAAQFSYSDTPSESGSLT